MVPRKGLIATRRNPHRNIQRPQSLSPTNFQRHNTASPDSKPKSAPLLNFISALFPQQPPSPTPNLRRAASTAHRHPSVRYKALYSLHEHVPPPTSTLYPTHPPASTQSPSHTQPPHTRAHTHTHTHTWPLQPRAEAQDIKTPFQTRPRTRHHHEPRPLSHPTNQAQSPKPQLGSAQKTQNKTLTIKHRDLEITLRD
ncbi:hypothetical protein B0H67DRAFT_87844 [Lasiosphaeris hirsuta]|uniref:Uncharacterized protein n=1 Tax=Lasiosphaeris hirsuta TaxID=260670 RepID=A0AA40EDZ0_9PEZI|nr:hypothetical protein B0H67DRAFT_87844 [Lasiosphaeris hirsuta]